LKVEGASGPAPLERPGPDAKEVKSLTQQDSTRHYTEPDCAQFVADMLDTGLLPFHYRGRFFWEGPAVAVDDLQDALGATKVRCQWDGFGLGWVVYPRVSDSGKGDVPAGADRPPGTSGSRGEAG
jgi:hypothetical protein